MRRFLMRVLNKALFLKPLPANAHTEVKTHARRKLVVGLGNPGMESTRHSIGRAVISALATQLGVGDCWCGDKHVSGEVILSEVQNVHVVLLRPKMLMNVNGVSVAKAAAKYNIKPEDILLVHDEMDKPFGKVVIKQGGSHRGHNGVRSCIDCLGTDVMSRLRVGIGRPPEKVSVVQHVLSTFSPEEKELLNSVLIQTVNLLLSQLSQSPTSPAGGRQSAQKRQRKVPPQKNPVAAAAAEN